jgi:outer membrane protein
MHKLYGILACMICIVISSPGHAEELPLWEAGFGLSGLTLPDYRGSNEQREYILPLPYLVYRGEILRLDRKGLYGILFQSKRVHINLSADGGVPVKSDRNSARAGMPDLDPTGQIGPSVEVCLLSDCDSDRSVQILFPVRAVFASDFSRIREVGFVANPQLSFDFRNLGSEHGWDLGLAFGPLFATDRYHAYYYSVPSPYAIPGVRSAYDARGGYSGSLFVISLTKRFEQVWFGAFVRYDELSGAVFADSPLVKTEHAVLAGIGIAWVFGQSPVLVNTTP